MSTPFAIALKLGEHVRQRSISANESTADRVIHTMLCRYGNSGTPNEASRVIFVKVKEASVHLCLGKAQ